MASRVKFTCSNGHHQELTYSSAFSREWIEMHISIMIGGELPVVGSIVPGSGCATCGDPVKYEIEEGVDEPVAT